MAGSQLIYLPAPISARILGDSPITDAGINRYTWLGHTLISHACLVAPHGCSVYFSVPGSATARARGRAHGPRYRGPGAVSEGGRYPAPQDRLAPPDPRGLVVPGLDRVRAAARAPRRRTSL